MANNLSKAGHGIIYIYIYIYNSMACFRKIIDHIEIYSLMELNNISSKLSLCQYYCKAAPLGRNTYRKSYMGTTQGCCGLV